MCHARGAQAELRREAVRLADEYREANKAALLNLLSDSTAALTLFAMLLRNTEGRTALFSTCGRVISGLSDTAKAFLIIAGALPSVCAHGQGCSLVHALVLDWKRCVLGRHRHSAGLSLRGGLDRCHTPHHRPLRVRGRGARAMHAGACFLPCFPRPVDMHAMPACVGGAHLCLCGNRARDNGRLLQTVDFPGPKPAEPSISSDTEEHGPPLGSTFMGIGMVAQQVLLLL